jgi:cell division protease FtsH
VIKPPQTFWIGFFYSMAPILVFITFLWYFSYRGMKGGMGGNVFSFGKHKARVTEGDENKVTFAKVAGVEEAKEELKEIIDFLKEPKKYEKLGGKIPKGVLLVGSPGCGKTLLAKAVAGEAGVPFYSISGSDFVEMFVGVGASRVRDLFEQAKKASKETSKGAIIFIDEIDAVGRQRFAGIGGGHDEREQTLNQLLVEMDGFEGHAGIIVMAATNRPDVLDPALLRPGRFDRHVVVDRPDVKGREEILNVHVKNIKLSPDVDLKKIARQTSGFTGADLANLCNEAALLAARRNKEQVEQSEINEAIERVMTGPERKSRVITKKEKRIVAVHESGHALMSLLKEDADPLHKVSIIPRGVAALGYTVQVPADDRYLKSKNELFTKICVLLAGRIAEEQIIGDMSTGASNDFQVATDIARRMVTEFGMSDKLGVVAYAKNSGPKFLGRDFGDTDHVSESTARVIDDEIKAVIDAAYAETTKALKDSSDKLNQLTTTLLEKEILDAKEVRELLGFPPAKEDEEPTVRTEAVIDANTGSTPTA